MPDIKQLVEQSLDRKKLEAFLVKLIKTPSYQTELYEKDPMIQELVQKVVRPELKDAGIKDISLDKMGNLIVKLGSKKSGKSLLYLAYAMTAAPGSMPDPFSGKLVDGKKYGLRGKAILGRGACEQKATLAAMLYAVAAIANSGLELPGELVFVVSTAGETGRHDSLKEIVEVDKIKTDYAIQSGEPKIQLGNKGRLDVIVTVEGKAVHSSVPWEGINAIEGMFKAYHKLGKLMPNPGSKSHPELGRATLTPIFIESFPRATHTVQSKCTMRMDRRLLPGEQASEALSQVSDAIGEIEKFKITVGGGPFMYPSDVPKTAPISRGLANAIKEMTGAPAEYSFSHQALDSGYLNEKGIQTVCYGSGQYGFAHTNLDLASLEDTLDAAKVFAYLALKGIKR